ncbi:hypothetical protein [Aeromicrobium fastidiosum]|uniref:CRIB domain-containing protein n=1 Tax=Aeromicrobium fastidiosum TaxID=52699 RepID=A0A641ALM4_9ACTN|nr:hypothetical protein [Aeromicrobium fastidiosum]KAA1376570.1 hypothetical protein ESP62_014230 [Aeromicrobium fastidiosum]MBP2391505.1 hypothetical protein [Aeromicrobium fastidiosum]
MTARTTWPPVIGVLVAAPWFAEMAWGGFPVVDLPLILLFLSPLYGCAALLIREVARRTGRGWPTMLLLGAAFGVLQAGVVDQSLFNPAYGRYDFQHPVHVGGIDISLYWALAFLSGHVVASMATPIALAEAWTRAPGRRRPWLGRRGVPVVATIYVLASVVNHLGVKEDEGHGFQARPVQTLTALAVVALLVLAALRWRRRDVTDVRVPRPAVVLGLGFAAYLLYLPGEGAAAAAVGVVVVTATIGVVGRWSTSPRWTDDHVAALVVGTVLVGAAMPFLVEPYDDSVASGTELVQDSAAAMICLLGVLGTWWRLRVLDRIDRGPTTSGP